MDEALEQLVHKISLRAQKTAELVALQCKLKGLNEQIASEAAQVAKKLIDFGHSACYAGDTARKYAEIIASNNKRIALSWTKKNES